MTDRSAVPESRPRILVLDDDESLLCVVRRMVNTLGYEVVAVSSPRKALELILGEGDFVALISDIQMPEMFGTDLVARLREAGNAIPVLLMSACVEITSAAPLLAKPFTIAGLTAKLAEIGVGRHG